MSKNKKQIQKKSQYHFIKAAWLARHKKAKRLFAQKHKEALSYVVEKFPAKEQLASSAVGALMLTSALPATTGPILGTSSDVPTETVHEVQVDTKAQMLAELRPIIGDVVRPLSDEEEVNVSVILARHYKINVSSNVDGLRLNRTYGVIGAEQHLMRYPGDTMASHLTADQAKDKFIYSSGMAPGRGAWGYFTKSKENMTNGDVEREKWYIAVQTFAAPNYNQRLGEYRDFFKYRKMLVMNTKTGSAVVCDIGDAGPAVWTGKHLGGSPEVMYALDLHKSMRKGPVLYFFINDPDGTIPLGPIAVK